jgi:hypothetical protein
MLGEGAADIWYATVYRELLPTLLPLMHRLRREVYRIRFPISGGTCAGPGVGMMRTQCVFKTHFFNRSCELSYK